MKQVLHGITCLEKNQRRNESAQSSGRVKKHGVVALRVRRSRICADDMHCIFEMGGRQDMVENPTAMREHERTGFLDLCVPSVGQRNLQSVGMLLSLTQHKRCGGGGA